MVSVVEHSLDIYLKQKLFAMREVSKNGAFSGPYFPVLSSNTGKYRPEKAPYLDTFHAVLWCKVRVWSKDMIESATLLLMFLVLDLYLETYGMKFFSSH